MAGGRVVVRPVAVVGLGGDGLRSCLGPPPRVHALKKVKNITILYLSLLFFQVSDVFTPMFTGATVWALLLFIWRYPRYYYKWKSASLYNVLIIPPIFMMGMKTTMTTTLCHSVTLVT